MAIDFTGRPPFFADVWRSPELQQTSPECFRSHFFSLGRYLAEFVIIFLAAALFVALAASKSSPLVFLVLAPVAIGYLAIGYRMRLQDRKRHVEIRDRELWAGVPALTRLGRISEVVYVEVSPTEDEWRDENGSTRIYLKLEDCEPAHTIFPLFISSGVSLKKLAQQIADIAVCPCSQRQGRSQVPEVVGKM